MYFYAKFHVHSYFKLLTSEVEVKVRSSKRISRCTSIQNFRFLALKITELWQFEIKSITYGTGRKLVTRESSSKSNKVNLANIENINYELGGFG